MEYEALPFETFHLYFLTDAPFRYWGVSVKPLQGKTAIVTGASRRNGIGAAVCLAFASQGADLFFTYWREYDRVMPWGEDRDWPDRLSELIKNEGVRVASKEIDLSDPNSPKFILDEVTNVFGGPSILINNATHSTSGGYETLDSNTLDDHYAVNVRGTCLLSVEFARRFNLPSGGRIINLISGQDKGPMPNELAYVATKGAISAFTVSLAAELASKKITVNAVDPGPTDTGWMSDQLKNHLLPKFPMGRIGLPDDVARVISFLASDDAEWITGQIIHSDGGYRC